MIHHVRARFFLAHSVQIYLYVWLWAEEVLVQTASTPFCWSAPGCGVTDSKTLPAPVSGLRSCAANQPMRDINKMTARGLPGKSEPSVSSTKEVLKKVPIRAESIAYLGRDGKMRPQAWTDEDQQWEIQQSMGGEWGRRDGYEQMEEWQNGTSVWWGEIGRKEGWKGEMWGAVMDEWLYQAVYPDYSSEFSAIGPPWKHFCEFIPLDEEWIMQ